MEDREFIKDAANNLRNLKRDFAMIEIAVLLITKMTESHGKDCDCLVCYETASDMPDGLKFLFVKAKKTTNKSKEAANV